MLMAQTTDAWTLADLDRLPNDGNKYELVDGELFVTPAPAPQHEVLIARLRKILDRYCEDHGLGRTYGDNAALRTKESELLPDLSVRQEPEIAPTTWAEMPLPILVIEVVSPTTRRRDHEFKRDFYLRIGVPEYWIVDGGKRTIRIVKPNTNDVVAERELTWHPDNATTPLTIDVVAFFHDALGDTEIAREDE